jgi:hypothetical protein
MTGARQTGGVQLRLGLWRRAPASGIGLQRPVRLRRRVHARRPTRKGARPGALARMRRRRIARGRRAAHVQFIKERLCGQIVVAPSMHRSGRRYRWSLRVGLAALPDWLYALLVEPRRRFEAWSPATRPHPERNRRHGEAALARGAYAIACSASWKRIRRSRVSRCSRGRSASGKLDALDREVHAAGLARLTQLSCCRPFQRKPSASPISFQDKFTNKFIAHNSSVSSPFHSFLVLKLGTTDYLPGHMF